jgi:methionyl-tRNA synthetase
MRSVSKDKFPSHYDCSVSEHLEEGETYEKAAIRGLTDGYLTIDGEKISKSKGNIIDPFILAKRYQVDAVRYFLLTNMPFSEDGDFTEKALVERINNELVANIGNFIHRILTFVWNDFRGLVPEPKDYDEYDRKFANKIKAVAKGVDNELEGKELDKALKRIVEFTTSCNQYFQQKEPWKTKDPTCLYLCTNALGVWPYF